MEMNIWQVVPKPIGTYEFWYKHIIVSVFHPKHSIRIQLPKSILVTTHRSRSVSEMRRLTVNWLLRQIIRWFLKKTPISPTCMTHIDFIRYQFNPIESTTLVRLSSNLLKESMAIFSMTYQYFLLKYSL